MPASHIRPSSAPIDPPTYNIAQKQKQIIRPLDPASRSSPISSWFRLPKSSPSVEHACWYLDWTSWDYPVPENVDMVNIFVGKIDLNAENQPVITGFGTLDDAKMRAFVQDCAKKNIKVKISLGGGGGQYDNCWNVLTDSNVGDFARGLANFCQERGLAGVDFDYEEQGDDALNKRVGSLIREFKKYNSSLQASYCTNAGFPTWQAKAQGVLDAAKDPVSGKCLLDRFYVMSYYNPIQDEQRWLQGWVDWLGKTYGMAPSQITAGIDDTDAHAYPIEDFSAWAGKKGLSTGYWCWNPTTQSASNASTKKIIDNYAPAPSYSISNTKEGRSKSLLRRILKLFLDVLYNWIIPIFSAGINILFYRLRNRVRYNSDLDPPPRYAIQEKA